MVETSRSLPRPMRSEMMETGMTQTASAPVAAEMVIAASVEVIPMSSTNVGSMAWVG